MPDPVWYYARGEVERGPFTTVQIKALAQAGKVRREDLVWKEGMENWTAAEEIKELFPAAAAVVEEKPAATTPAADSPPLARGHAGSPVRLSAEVIRLTTATGWGCVIVGLFSVVLARGCESLGERKVARMDAAARLQADEAWQQQRSTIAAEMNSLQKKGRLAPAEQDRFRELAQNLKQLDDTRSAEELATAQRLGVNRALAEFRSAAFTRGIALHGGVLFLSLGSLALAILGTTTDRWLGVGLVLVLCYAALSGGG